MYNKLVIIKDLALTEWNSKSVLIVFDCLRHKPSVTLAPFTPVYLFFLSEINILFAFPIFDRAKSSLFGDKRVTDILHCFSAVMSLTPSIFREIKKKYLEQRNCSQYTLDFISPITNKTHISRGQLLNFKKVFSKFSWSYLLNFFSRSSMTNRNSAANLACF